MNPFLKDVAIDLKNRFGEDLHETAIIFKNCAIGVASDKLVDRRKNS